MLRHLLPLTLLLACSGKEEGDDTGSATDTNVGETGDTAPPAPVYTSLAGTLTYYQEQGGVPKCDADIAITSRPYTGDCGDCDFAFYVDAEITRDDSAPDCEYHPLLSLLGGSWGPLDYYDLSLLHFPEMQYGAYTFYNYVQIGYSALYYGYDYPGPYYFAMGYGGGYLGRTTFRDNELVVDFYYSAPAYLFYNYTYLDACGAKEIPPSTDSARHEGATGTSRLTCDGLTGDMWEFTVAEGTDIGLTLDTLADETAFDPLVVINGPDGCTQVLAQDNRLCTYQPATYLCPSWSQPRAEGGVWQAIVLNMGSCNGTEAEYVLSVEGVEGIRLVADDFDAWTSYGESFLLTALLDVQVTEQE